MKSYPLIVKKRQTHWDEQIAEEMFFDYDVDEFTSLFEDEEESDCSYSEVEDCLGLAEVVNEKSIEVYIDEECEVHDLYLDKCFENVEELVIGNGIKKIHFSPFALLQIKKLTVPESCSCFDFLCYCRYFLPKLEVLVMKSTDFVHYNIFKCNFVVCQTYYDPQLLRLDDDEFDPPLKEWVMIYTRVKEENIIYLDDVYYLKCNGYMIAIKVNCDAKEIIIKESVDGLPVKTIGSFAFANSKAEKVIIYDTVKKIYDDDFFNIYETILIDPNYDGYDNGEFDRICRSIEESNTPPVEKIKIIRPKEELEKTYVDTTNIYKYSDDIMQLLYDAKNKDIDGSYNLFSFSDSYGATYKYDVYECNNNYYAVIKQIIAYNNACVLNIPSFIRGIKVIGIVDNGKCELYCKCDEITDIVLGDNLEYLEGTRALKKVETIWIDDEFSGSINLLVELFKNMSFDNMFVERKVEFAVAKGNKYYCSIDGTLYTKDGKTLIKTYTCDGIWKDLEKICSYAIVSDHQISISAKQFNDYAMINRNGKPIGFPTENMKNGIIYGDSTICPGNKKILRNGQIVVNPKKGHEAVAIYSNIKYIHPNAIIKNDDKILDLEFKGQNPYYDELEDIINQPIKKDYNTIIDLGISAKMLASLPKVYWKEENDPKNINLLKWKYRKLTKLEVDRDVENIFAPPFAICDIEEVNVCEDNMNYASCDGILFDKKMNELLFYPPMKKDTMVNIASIQKDIKKKLKELEDHEKSTKTYESTYNEADADEEMILVLESDELSQKDSLVNKEDNYDKYGDEDYTILDEQEEYYDEADYYGDYDWLKYSKKQFYWNKFIKNLVVNNSYHDNYPCEKRRFIMNKCIPTFMTLKECELGEKKRTLHDEIKSSSDDIDYIAGANYVDIDKVKSAKIGTYTATMVIEGPSRDFEVEVESVNGGLISRCQCYMNNNISAICIHQKIALKYLLKEYGLLKKRYSKEEWYEILYQRYEGENNEY